MKTEIKKGLAYRRVAGEMFIVDAARAELHELNDSAALIWEGLASGKNTASVAASLAAEYGIDAHTARADVEGFMAELLKTGLLSGPR